MGKWIFDMSFGFTIARCPRCGAEYSIELFCMGKIKRCPNCGIELEAEETDER